MLRKMKSLAIIVMAFTVSIGIVTITAGCNNRSDFTQGGAPLFFEEQYLFLDIGETARLDVREIFKHSGINISDYVLSSSSEWIASINNNVVTAHRAGNPNNNFIGQTTISVALYDRSTRIRYFVPVAQVFVVDESYLTEIKTVDDLISIRDNLDGWYILKSNIDLSGNEWQGMGGTFSGVLINRGGFVIKNLTGATGLFGVNTGYIYGLHLENVFIDQTHVEDDFIMVGAIVSRNDGSGTIANSSVKGVVKSSGITGGIVGSNRGRVINSTFDGVVRNISNRTADEMLDRENIHDVAGGIVGINEGIIAHSNACGQISASLVAGGIVGINFTAITNARIFNSYFVFLPDTAHRLVAPIWGNPIGWERTLVGRN